LFTSISRLAFRRVIADLQAAGCLDAAALTNWSAPALSTAFKSPQHPKTNSANRAAVMAVCASAAQFFIALKILSF